MYVCIACGETFTTRASLGRHWRDELHHLKVGQAQALDRARNSISATPLSEPTRAQMVRLIDAEG